MKKLYTSTGIFFVILSILVLPPVTNAMNLNNLMNCIFFSACSYDAETCNTGCVQISSSACYRCVQKNHVLGRSVATGNPNYDRSSLYCGDFYWTVPGPGGSCVGCNLPLCNNCCGGLSATNC